MLKMVLMLLLLLMPMIAHSQLEWKEGPIALRVSEPVVSATPANTFIIGSLTYPNGVVREIRFWLVPGGLNRHWAAPVTIEMRERRVRSVFLTIAAGEFQDLAGNRNAQLTAHIVVDASPPEFEVLLEKYYFTELPR